MTRQYRTAGIGLVAIAFGLAFALCAAGAEGPTYTLTPDEYGLVVRAPDGLQVLRYMTRKPAQTNLSANSVCCLYPVYTPGGVPHFSGIMRWVGIAPFRPRNMRTIARPTLDHAHAAIKIAVVDKARVGAVCAPGTGRAHILVPAI